FASRRRQTRCYRDWSSDVCSSDLVPDEALAHWRLARERGARLEAEWSKKYDAYRQAYPELAAELERRLAGRLAEGWDEGLPTFAPSPADAQATRVASGKVLNAIAAK